MRVVFEFHGETQIDRQFERWQAYPLAPEPAFEAIYQYLLGVEARQFRSEGEYSGHVWQELAEATVVRKARLGLQPEILRATDSLLSSLTEEGDVNQLKEIRPDSMAFGSTLARASYHQHGTSRMPQRRPIDLHEQNKQVILKALQLWITRGVAKRIPITQSAAFWESKVS